MADMVLPIHGLADSGDQTWASLILLYSLLQTLVGPVSLDFVLPGLSPTSFVQMAGWGGQVLACFTEDLVEVSGHSTMLAPHPHPQSFCLALERLSHEESASLFTHHGSNTFSLRPLNRTQAFLGSWFWYPQYALPSQKTFALSQHRAWNSAICYGCESLLITFVWYHL